MLVARQLRNDEALPPNLLTGFEGHNIIPEWAWVIEHRGQIVGVFLACDAHGMAFLLRLVMDPAAPKAAALVLLRKAFDDLVGRGLKVFMTIFQDSKVEYKLARLCDRMGATFIPFQGALAVGKLKR